MSKIPGVDAILSAAELISDVRKAFTRIEKLEQSQETLAEALRRLDDRVRELEAGLREAKSEIKLEAVKEAQGIVNSVQSHLYSEIREISIQLNTIAMTGPDLGTSRSSVRSAPTRKKLDK